jgi:hypothetical protein
MSKYTRGSDPMRVEEKFLKPEYRKPVDLVFTTSYPGFMCDTSNCNQELIDKLEGPRKLTGFDGKRCEIYIDGQLERDIGFDIPIWISGEIRYTTDAQPCTVWSVDGSVKYGALLTFGHKTHTPLRVRGYIRAKGGR